MRRLMVAMATAVILSAFMANPVSADDVPCSSFTLGVVPPIHHNYNIIVDTSCVVLSGATINGSLIEPTATSHGIGVANGVNIDGDILEKGDGAVGVFVAGGFRFNGSIKEEGGGNVDVIVQNGGDFYNGNIEEKDDGNVSLTIGATGDFNGNVIEQDGGVCNVTAPPGQPRGNADGCI